MSSESNTNVGPTFGQWAWHGRYPEHDGSVYATRREGHAYAVAMMPRYQSDEQWEADAALIAAAPELLDALKRVRDRFFPADQPERDQDLLWAPVNEAIAKAEGRTPSKTANPGDVNEQ